MKIQFLKREDIDKTKWNSCVHFAHNGNIFGYMWYLDNVAKEWDALVEGDYESVFPLIGRTKYLGVKELYQPLLMRECGLYSSHQVTPQRSNAFLEAIPAEYKVLDIHLNEQQQLETANYPKWKLTQQKNHQLYLLKSYDDIALKYTPATVQKLEQGWMDNLIPSNAIKPEQIVDFWKKYTKNRQELDRSYHAYLRIMYNLLHRGWGNGAAILDSKQNILGVNFFVYSHSKVMRLLSAYSPEGIKKGADLLQYDLLIRNHAGKPFILDFNTSEDFPLAYGAEATFYQKIQRDNRKWKIF